MGELSFEDFGASGVRAAAVICRTEHGNLHAGVLYLSEGEQRVLHLGWEDYLSDSWEWLRLWGAPDAEPEKLGVAAARCRLVWKKFQKERKFPYALAFKGTTFDSSGKLQFGPDAKGLTCATFVLAVFRSAGIDLVDENSWSVRTDDDQAFLESIRKWASSPHFTILEAEVKSGVCRIRPAEVLGACTLPIPATFAATASAAQAVERRLDEHAASAPLAPAASESTASPLEPR